MPNATTGWQFRTRSTGLIRDGWLIVGIVLTFCVLIEAAAGLALRVSRATTIDPRVKADAYASAPWVQDYFREFTASYVARWMPYTYWRRPAFRGRYINVDADGIRVTPQSAVGQDSARPPVTIFMFGGSALWGTGARDDFTIPAILGGLLRKDRIPSRVVNFGESGHVSTQEVVALLLQLKQGHVPEVVIFYDGINDAYSAYQQHVAGLPQNEFHRVEEFNLTDEDRLGRLAGALVRHGAHGLATMRGVRAAVGWFGFGAPAIQALSPAHANALAGEVGKAYWDNVRLVASMGARYGFRSLFYWQPAVFQKKHLTPYESAERLAWQDFGRFHQNATEAVGRMRPTAEGQPAFWSLDAIVADVSAPLFIDFAHVSEEANDLIAHKIAADVVAALVSRTGVIGSRSP